MVAVENDRLNDSKMDDRFVRRKVNRSVGKMAE